MEQAYYILCPCREINVVNRLRKCFQCALWTARSSTFINAPKMGWFAPAKPKAGQTHEMVLSDFYLVARPDLEYGAAHIALRQIRRQGRIRQQLLPYKED